VLRVKVGEAERKFRGSEVGCGRVSVPLAVRLDGVGWGKALLDFSWPRDERVHKALVETALELMRNFGADVAYVISDEINLVFSKYSPYGGRVFKIVSVLAGKASSSITIKLQKPLSFDARIVKLENLCDCYNYVAYRARVGFNNYVSSLYHAKKGSAPTPNLEEMLNEVPLDAKWAYAGTLLVRVWEERTRLNSATGTVVKYARRVVKELTLGDLEGMYCS